MQPNADVERSKLFTFISPCDQNTQQDYLFHPTKGLLEFSSWSQVSACSGHGVHVTRVGYAIC